jgi:NADH-quinone oxidoreductase subunit L
VPVTWLAFGTAVFGIGLAAAFYWKGFVNPAEVRQQFGAIYTFLRNKWYFDELYDFIFVRPTMVFSRLIAGFDRRWIDGFIDNTARVTVWFTRLWDLIVDRSFVDGSINTVARWTYSLGDGLREVQTGKLRQYVLFIVVATVAIFVLLVFFSTMSVAG